MDEQQVVTNQDDVEDIEEEGKEEAVAGDNKTSRAAKRSNRYKEAVEAAKRAEERAARNDEQIGRLNETITRLMSMQTTPAQPAEDPIKVLLKEKRDLDASYALIHPQATPEQAKSYLDKVEALEERLAKARIEAYAPRPRQESRNTLADLVRDANPDVFTHPQASKYAGLAYQQAQIAGEPLGPEEMQAIVQRTREKFGIRPQVTDSAKAKFSGHGSSVGTGNRQETANVDLNDPTIRKMINKRFAHLPEAERAKAFQNQVLKRMTK